MMVLLLDVTPPLGPSYTLLAFVIVITGGLGSMPGALLGGMLIGVTEALAGLLFSGSGPKNPSKQAELGGPDLVDCREGSTDGLPVPLGTSTPFMVRLQQHDGPGPQIDDAQPIGVGPATGLDSG